MFLRLITESKYFEILNSELCKLMDTEACLSIKSGTYYEISKLGANELRKIGWILDYYKNTDITILNELEE